MHHRCKARSAESQPRFFRREQVCATAPVPEEAKNQQEAEHGDQSSSAAACLDPGREWSTTHALLVL